MDNDFEILDEEVVYDQKKYYEVIVCKKTESKINLNDDELLKQITLFEEQLSLMKKAIKEEDEESIKSMMRLSTLRRSYFDE